MKVDFLSQAGKLLKEQKQYRRRAVVFLCLAVIVGYGTVMALKLYGQAMTHKMEVLDCSLEAHEHTEECYKKDEAGNPGGELICGYADYVVHVHNDGCYDRDGKLVCALEEHEAHEHNDECYVTEMVLVCGEESADGMHPESTDGFALGNAGTAAGNSGGTDDGAGNAGTSAAGNSGNVAGAQGGMGSGDGLTAAGNAGDEGDKAVQTAPEARNAAAEPACGMEIHKHTEKCYEKIPVCGYAEEHVHDGNCTVQELACEAGEHTHGEGCFDADGNAVCGMEEHVHLTGCYDGRGNLVCGAEPHTHDENCRDGQGNIVCGMGEHAHIVGCYKEVYTCGKEEHTHEDECYSDGLICEMEEHEHSDTCYTQAGSGGGTGAEAGGIPETQNSTESGTPGTTDPAAESAPREETPESGASGGGTSAGDGATAHVHTDACYKEVTRLACGELELHTHDDSCYAPECFDEEGNLIEGSARSCGLLQLEEHVHQGDCFKTVELTPEEVAALNNGAKLHIHEDSCYDGEGQLICGHDATHIHVLECYDDGGNLICGYGTASHVHEDKCYDAAGGLICGYETAAHVHEDSCYDTEGSLHCGYDTASHGHEPGCYDEEGNLICGYETAAHVHEDGCYDAEGNLICGYDTASHGHTDSCVDAEGNLICGYDTACHLHTDSCYDEEGSLTCGYETAKHVHEDSCYNEDGNLICGYETAAHMHEDSCYDEDGNVICGFEDAKVHEHDSGCYDEEGNLVCGYEGARNHEHDAACYGEDNNLICGYEGVRDHRHDAGCYDGEGKLTCGFRGVKDHEHDISCYDEEGSLTCGYEGMKDHEHDAKCYDLLGENLVCGYEGVEFHEHTEGCVDADGNLICGYEVPTEYENRRECIVGSYFVIVKYNDDANIPEEAEFRAEAITPDSADGHYENREAEYQKAVNDKNATMKALLKIGFYLNGEEIEPETPVVVTVQFLDEDGLVEGKPITVIHFAEDGIEKLDGSDAKDNSTTFQMESFSEIAIGYDKEGNTRAVKDGKLYISNDFECDVDPFHIVFHVEGEPKTMDGKPVIIELPKAEDAGDETGAEGEGTGLDSEITGGEAAGADSEITGGEDAGADSEVPGGEDTAPGSWEAEGGGVAPDSRKAEGAGTASDSDGTEEEGVQESEGSLEETEDADGADTVPDNETDAEGNAGLEAREVKLHIDFLDEDSELRAALMAYIGESTEMVSRNIIHLISYRLTYGETELDLSDCTVTVEITLGTSTSDGEEEGITDGGLEDGTVGGEQAPDGEPAANTEMNGFIVNAPEEGDEGEVTITPQDPVVVSNADAMADTETVQTLKGVLNAEDTDTEISVTAIGVSEDRQMSTLGQVTLNGENPQGQMDFPINGGIMALTEESTSNPTFQVQYYAYVQKMATEKPNIDEVRAIEIIDTVKEGQDGVLGGAQLPDNSGKPRTRNMYVAPSSDGPYTSGWPVFDPVYLNKDSIDSLTKIYTADLYEFKEAAGGLEHINKFAKDGLNYDLFEVWVLNDESKADSINKDDWMVYSGDDIKNLVFHNNDAVEDGKITVHITVDTVVRLVGRSNEEVNKNYPARFFDYDFTDGTSNNHLKGINDPLNYKKDANGNVIEPRYGIGNNNSPGINGENTGVADDKWPGTSDKYTLYINRAKTKRDGKTSVGTIIEKCFFGLTESALSQQGYPVIKANAPDLFNPQVENVVGREEISGYSLNFNRDGDTYTLTAVSGSGSFAQNLDQFQKVADKAWGTDAVLMTNQFWPMDNAPTFGDTANNHDPKFGTQAQYDELKFIKADDGKEHNSFFGMNFEVEFELTDDYVGPLNYYFFGDDDMWVFLEKPDGSTQLICDIGGVHQAAGEYVDLWNYIQKPEDNLVKNNASGENAEEEGRVNPKYKLKFFYTERGASGSTCWMQFTLPSVNAVPVIDYTGNVKSTLTMGKKVEGETTDQRFDFTIEFSGSASNIATNDYPYKIKNQEGSLVESGDIRSGGTFKLGHNQTIEVFNLPDGTNYTIRESEYPGYEPGLGTGSTGTIAKDETVEGNIDWDRDDIVDFINHEVEYNLPETGGSGRNLYTIAGGMALLLGAGFLYKKKFGERRVQDSL